MPASAVAPDPLVPREPAEDVVIDAAALTEDEFARFLSALCPDARHPAAPRTTPPRREEQDWEPMDKELPQNAL